MWKPRGTVPTGLYSHLLGALAFVTEVVLYLVRSAARTRRDLLPALTRRVRARGELLLQPLLSANRDPARCCR
jgi:hypothetical protein